MYIIKKISQQDSQKIWEDSPNSSIFNNPKFLKKFNKIKYYAAFKGQEPFVCWPVQINEKNEMGIPYMFYYFGPFWSSKAFTKNEHSKFSSFAITNYY